MNAQLATAYADQPQRETSMQAPPRPVVFRTRGSTRGPITRLMSPGDLGQLVKPFVFLDLFTVKPSVGEAPMGMHPHSGIATLTYLMEGEVGYEDSTGKQGTLPTGGVEWMRAGNGVWHDGVPVGQSSAKGFQLWVALPAAEENAPAQSLYLSPADVPVAGPVRVLLGRYGALESKIPAPADMTYLSVQLQDGERWRYVPPAGHSVAWIAVHTGQLEAAESIGSGEMAVFKDAEQAIDVVAVGATSFVLGSAVKHPHDLVMGHYSVHTSTAALAQGEAEIRRIGAQLRAKGRLA
ncbi:MULTISPECIES: pirin family protein [Xanthomonas]|uniref:Pirin family protein n=1 Tax=Xanthomonas dyei TaxID=743699 RepID=A0ABZ0DFC9_9XANT|nr:pirin family protein [Xanthomonas dyei]WOB26510.1 pirin family protein [Xanthomonas dyei]WOB54130.1 pirin family protein [Xanthomonas dyei]